MKNKNNINKRLVLLAGLLLTATLGLAQQPALQYFRPYDQRGVNVFETSKKDTVKFDGMKMRLGANFTQGFQTLSHSNSAKALLTGTGLPTLIETAPGSGSFVNQATGAAVTGITQHPSVLGGYVNATNQMYTNSNQLYDLTNGFPLAQANLNIDV